MAEGLSTLIVTQANVGPEKQATNLTLENVLRYLFDFGRSILIVELENGTKKEFQYDDLSGVTWVPATNTVTITNA